MQNESIRPYAAHISEEQQNARRIQGVEEHCKGVAQLAQSFAEKFGIKNLGEWVYISGLYHDIGKYSKEFQARIWDHHNKVDHATAGAQEVIRIANGLDRLPQNGRDIFAHCYRKLMPLIVAYCISGHHSGLLNGGSIVCDAGTLSGRLLKRIPEYGAYKKEISEQLPNANPLIKQSTEIGATAAFLTRMMYSCLTDADWLDTEAFMQGAPRSLEYDTIEDLHGRLQSFIAEKGYLRGKEGIQKIRSDILSECINVGAEGDASVYTLTVPTGGGKTVASLAFALENAVSKGKSRVIYVIPYCSIIDQTVDVFERILGTKNVLAHYSESNYEESKENEDDDVDGIRLQKKLACENWDAPVVVTTAVQFFESCYSNRGSACRKLHNMANSVIIFDEAQTVPLPYLLPCVHAMSELAANYRSTIVLCTATQPRLETYIQKYFKDLTVSEICTHSKKDFGIFDRVVFVQRGVLTDEELAQELNSHHQVLCIVSTRKQARNVAKLLNDEENYHLSTFMIPVDRKATIDTIRERLAAGKTCRLVATSLIEAGVDLDFPCVYRAYAGLDSMIQAAGRCNREGKRSLEESKVFLFEPDKKYKMPSSMQMLSDVARNTITGETNLSSEKTIGRYFESIHDIVGVNLDEKRIIPQSGWNRDYRTASFSDIAKEFRLIESEGANIFIDVDDESHKIAIKLLDGYEPLNRSDYRKMGKYCISVFPGVIDKLQGSISKVDNGLWVLDSSTGMYDRKLGLKLEENGNGLMIY